MAAFTGGAYGSGSRLEATGFLASEQLMGAEPALLDAFRQRGFTVTRRPPFFAAGLFATCAVMVACWHVNWFVIGDDFDYGVIMAVVGISSALFYAGTLVTMLWALDTVRRHETGELLLREFSAAALGPDAAEPGDEMVRRWERQANRIVLFLVVALPIAFSPTLAAHVFLIGAVPGNELVLPLACFLPHHRAIDR